MSEAELFHDLLANPPERKEEVQMERELKPKKKWDKPKLIILTRGKPEERVLVYCKGTPFGGPDNYDDLCLLVAPPALIAR